MRLTTSRFFFGLSRFHGFGFLYFIIVEKVGGFCPSIMLHAGETFLLVFPSLLECEKNELVFSPTLEQGLFFTSFNIL